MSAANFRDINQRMKFRVQALHQLVDKISSGSEIKVKMLQETIHESSALLQTLQDVLSVLKKDKDTQEFLNEMQAVMQQLQILTDSELEKRFPRNFIFYCITSSFEKYIRKNIPKRVLAGMRAVADYVPFINNAIVPCEILPFSWDYCKNNKEKVAIAIFAALFVAAIALTLAVYASPALAAIPFIGVGILLFGMIAKVLFQQVSAGPIRRYEEHQTVKVLANKVDEEIIAMEMMLEHFDSKRDPDKQSLFQQTEEQMQFKRQVVKELRARVNIKIPKQPEPEIGIKPSPLLPSGTVRKRRISEQKEYRIPNLSDSHADKKRR